MRGYTVLRPFVEYDEREHLAVSREFTTILCRTPSAVGMVEHSVRRERSTTFTVSSGSKSPSATNLSQGGAMSAMRLLRFYDSSC
jgi:hypothetical protein